MYHTAFGLNEEIATAREAVKTGISEKLMFDQRECIYTKTKTVTGSSVWLIVQGKGTKAPIQIQTDDSLPESK